MKHYAILVAGGTGSRMNAELPKQFLLIAGKPVLMHTIEAFYNSDLKPEIILVLNSAYVDLWTNLCTQYEFDIPFTLAKNGDQRFYSVKNGLELVDENAIVAVHDAVRPIVSNELITRTFSLAVQKKAVIPVVVSKDSVRKRSGNTTVALNRDEILLVQTPQVFTAMVLKKAYLKTYNSSFTDDASVVEADNVEIFTTEGDYTNIKITYPSDVALAELYLADKAKKNPA